MFLVVESRSTSDAVQFLSSLNQSNAYLHMFIQLAFNMPCAPFVPGIFGCQMNVGKFDNDLQPSIVFSEINYWAVFIPLLAQVLQSDHWRLKFLWFQMNDLSEILGFVLPSLTIVVGFILASFHI